MTVTERDRSSVLMSSTPTTRSVARRSLPVVAVFHTDETPTSVCGLRASSSSWQLPLDRSVSTPCLLPHQPWNAGVRQFRREFYVHAFPLKHCSTFSRFVSEWVSSAGTWHVMADLSEAVKCISTGQQTHHNQHNTEHNTDCAKTLTQQVSAVSAVVPIKIKIILKNFKMF